jgi:hypothetical protein
MCEWHVVVGNVVEEVNLLLWQHQGRGNAVNRSIAPALIEETASPVQMVEVVDVLFRSQPVEVADLEV